MEFSRDTDYKLDIRDSTNTEAILMSKDWFSIVPLIHRYQKVDIREFREMQEQYLKVEKEFGIG